MFFFNIEKWDW